MILCKLERGTVFFLVHVRNYELQIYLSFDYYHHNYDLELIDRYHRPESHCSVRVQRFPEKALILQDEYLSKGASPALISTCPFSDQFILKESQNRFLPSDFGRLLE